jgi:flagellar hook assembly protein FlgD
MNGDFVSAEPEIEVRLKDENRFLLKTDSKGMTMILTRQCSGCLPESSPLDSSNSRVRIYPAGPGNLFRIVFKPGKLSDGQYRLAVQGTDVKGNAAGSQFYEVDFNVLDKNTISNFFPYPNPFSTSCQWVFTLTGREPEDFKIQVMTVTGRVVREIFKSELGPINIGNNVTSYRWDGTDEFGDRLANGVYLYRVLMKEGSEFIHRETAGDFTFRKGFGKLYIIR